MQWEASAQAARDAGARVAHPRIGVVLAPEGGALAKMKTPFKMGVGGKIGDGSQYMPWVHVADVARMIAFAVDPPRQANGLADPGFAQFSTGVATVGVH